MAKSENAVASLAQLEASKLGVLTQRNNVGACVDATGRMIRYGLMNESVAVNRKFKSSDIIGCIPVQIQPHHVGQVLGVYAAFETKHEGWKFSEKDERAQAQLNYIKLVRQYGGTAAFITDPVQIHMAVYDLFTRGMK